MIPSVYSRDTEPSTHSNGFTASLVQQNDPFIKQWSDGNGSGSEKHDVFEEYAKNSKDLNSFHARAARAVLPSMNSQDKAPTSHSNGFTASLAQTQTPAFGLAQVLKAQQELGE